MRNNQGFRRRQVVVRTTSEAKAEIASVNLERDGLIHSCGCLLLFTALFWSQLGDYLLNLKCVVFKAAERKRKMKVTQLCLTLYSPWNSPGQSTGVGGLSLLLRVFPTLGLNSGFPHCRWILYHMSHKGCFKEALAPQLSFHSALRSVFKP